MATEPGVAAQPRPRSWQLSLDWWAVLAALALAVLVLAGIIPNVPW